MKCIIRQALLLLTLIAIIHESKCDFELSKYRLSRLYENLIEDINMNYKNKTENEIGLAYDMDCVKTFLNLPQNNEMMVNQFDVMIFYLATGMKCSDEDKFFETKFDGYVLIGSLIELSCIQSLLQQLEPTSKLVENFNISEADRQVCDKILPVEAFVKLQQEFESKLGPLNVYTCGAVSENGASDFMRFFTKGVIIRFSNISDELRKSEKKKLKEYWKDISIRTVRCITKRFEDDPQAFLINDTLNYYYNQELVLIDPEEDDKQDNNKRLIKLQEIIDYDCVKEKLNLQQNGDITLPKAEARILIAAAKSKCIKIDPIEFSNLFIEFAIDNSYATGRHVVCAKLKLQQLEPTSMLAVTSSSDEIHKDQCRYYRISLTPYSVPKSTYKEQVGRLSETTCGVVSDEFEDIISLKTLLLFNEKDMELKVSETLKLFNEISEKLQKVSDCILNRIK